MYCGGFDFGIDITLFYLFLFIFPFVLLFIVLSVHIVFYINCCTGIPISASEPRCSIVLVHVICLTFVYLHMCTLII